MPPCGCGRSSPASRRVAGIGRQGQRHAAGAGDGGGQRAQPVHGPGPRGARRRQAQGNDEADAQRLAGGRGIVVDEVGHQRRGAARGGPRRIDERDLHRVDTGTAPRCAPQVRAPGAGGRRRGVAVDGDGEIDGARRIGGQRGHGQGGRAGDHRPEVLAAQGLDERRAELDVVIDGHRQSEDAPWRRAGDAQAEPQVLVGGVRAHPRGRLGHQGYAVGHAPDPVAARAWGVTPAACAGVPPKGAAPSTAPRTATTRHRRTDGPRHGRWGRGGEIAVVHRVDARLGPVHLGVEA